MVGVDGSELGAEEDESGEDEREASSGGTPAVDGGDLSDLSLNAAGASSGVWIGMDDEGNEGVGEERRADMVDGGSPG